MYSLSVFTKKASRARRVMAMSPRLSCKRKWPMWSYAALGGASGGFTSGKKEVVEMLRQRSRPYLFSNTVAPSVGCVLSSADYKRKHWRSLQLLCLPCKYCSSGGCGRQAPPVLWSPGFRRQFAVGVPAPQINLR